MRQSHNFKNLDKYLGIISECPLCKAKIMDLNVIEESNNSYLIHSRCKKCENSVLLLALATELGVNVIGMATDLSIDEIVKLRNTEASISSDDVIEMYKLLKKKSFVKELLGAV